MLLIAVLHFIPDADDPYAIVARLMDAVPSGSFLVISHAARDIAGPVADMTRRYNELSPVPVTPPTRSPVARFFGGLDVTGPGVVPIGQWWAPGGRRRGQRPGRLLRHRQETVSGPKFL